MLNPLLHPPPFPVPANRSSLKLRVDFLSHFAASVRARLNSNQYIYQAAGRSGSGRGSFWDSFWERGVVSGAVLAGTKVPVGA